MILIKPDGREVEVNQRSVEHALSLGWKPKELPKETESNDVAEVSSIDAPKRRGPKPKVKDVNDSSTAG